MDCVKSAEIPFGNGACFACLLRRLEVLMTRKCYPRRSSQNNWHSIPEGNLKNPYLCANFQR